MNVEALCPPQGEFSEVLKTTKGFGLPIGAVRAEVAEQRFTRSVIKGLTIISSSQVLEKTKKLPTVKTKTVEDLFGPRADENIFSLPSEQRKREEIMQSVVFLPTRPPAEITVAKVIPEPQKEKPRENILNGFNSQAEVEALQRNVANSPKQAVRENLANMSRYHDEYTKSDPVVDNPLMLDEDGDLANSDSGLKLLPLISCQERKGGVKEMMSTVQTMVKDAKEGEVVVGVSSRGGTEVPDYQSGKEMIYTESQVYVYIKGKGRQIRALTFITDMTFEESVRFYQSFAEPDPTVLDENASDIDRISELVRRPILVTGEKIDFAGILKRIEDTMDGRKVMRAANGKDRTFEEAYQLIELGEKIHSLPEKCKEVSRKYQDFLEANLDRINEPNVAESVRQRMDIAMLEMTRIINFKGDTQPDNLVYLRAFSTLAPEVMDMKQVQSIYQREIFYLLTRPGCNGSGEASNSLTGQSLGDILSGGKLIGGDESSALVPKCIRCTKALCEGRCFNCEKKSRRAA